MSKPTIALVVNPAANKGRAGSLALAVQNLLEPLATVSLLAGTSAEESVDLIGAAATSADAIFVYGGDGLVHLAVNVLAQTDVPLGIVPGGTGNDNADVLGLPPDPVQASAVLVESLAAGSLRTIDLGYCNGPSLVAGRTGRWFMGVLYGGFDSATNERANALRWPKGKRRYDLAILAELAGLRTFDVRLELDDLVLTKPVTLVAIGNTRQYGGGKRITPDAQFDDGIFDVTVVGPVTRRRLAKIAPKLPTAGHIGEPEVSTYRARSVRFEGSGIVAYADGERVGPLPLSVSIVENALRVVVPRR